MIVAGGSAGPSDREYPDHSHAPIPLVLLPKEARERILRDREAEKVRRQKAREVREAREEERAQKARRRLEGLDEYRKAREGFIFAQAVSEAVLSADRTAVEVAREEERLSEEAFRRSHPGPSETVRRVVSGRYDLDTGEIVTEGPLNGRQVMFTMKVLKTDPSTLTESGVMTVFGRKGVQEAVFSTNDPKGFAKTLGDYIEENREELGV